jgi:signal transduction histidine kinase
MLAPARTPIPNLWCNAGCRHRPVRAILVCLLLLLAHTVTAGDHITERAVFEDANASLDLAQVQSQAFTPFSGILSRGYGRSALWIRLQIEPGIGEADETLILRIRPGYLDEVRLYDPYYRSLGTAMTGDNLPGSADAYRSLNNNLVIPQGEQPRGIWLRVASTSSRVLQVQALSGPETLRLDRQQEMLYSLFLAFLALLSLWGASHWLIRPDRLLLLFTLKQTVGLIYMVGYLGYAREFWPEGLTAITPGQYTDWSLPLYTLLGFLFDYHLLRSFHANALGLKLLLVLAAGLVFEYALLLLDQSQQAFMLNGVVVLIGVCLTLLLALTTPNPEKLAPGNRLPLSRRAIILLYSAIFLGFMTSVLPLLGLTQASFLVFDGFLIYSLVSGLAMLLVMIRRMRESERQLTAAEAARECAERRAEAELEQRQEQAQFLTMLTHELKTPLAVVRMVLGAKTLTDDMKDEAERSIRDMNHIVQRCMQVERLNDQDVPGQRLACCLAEELADIIQHTTQAHRVDLLSEAPPTILETDPLLLRLIVANLIDNACKYSPADSTITVCLSAPVGLEPNGFSIRVANLPGKAGWPDPQQVFQKYYRHPRAHEYTGSGLGLFLSARLAKQLGGELRYCPTAEEVVFELCFRPEQG